jgi:hypothetical protein
LPTFKLVNENFILGSITYGGARNNKIHCLIRAID